MNINILSHLLFLLSFKRLLRVTPYARHRMFWIILSYIAYFQLKPEKTYKNKNKKIEAIRVIPAGENKPIHITDKTFETYPDTTHVQQLEAESNKFERETQDLKAQLEKTTSEVKAWKKKHEETESILAEMRQVTPATVLQKEIEELKRTNGQLREEMMKRQMAANVRSQFPNVKDLLNSFEDLHTNGHANLSQFLVDLQRKLENNLDKKHPKVKHLQKSVYQLLWDMLFDCYNNMLLFEAEIYQNIGQILRIDNHFDSGKEIEEKTEKPEKKKEILKFVIGAYLQQNYEMLLRSVPPSANNNTPPMSKLDTVIALLKTKYELKMPFLRQLEEDDKEELTELLETYLNKCCEISWVMMLHDVPLSFSPSEFEPKEVIMFDEIKHRKCPGSDKHNQQIWYYVWPAIKRGDVLLNLVPFIFTGPIQQI